MKFVAGKGNKKSFAKCDEMVVFKVASAYKICNSSFGKSLIVDVTEINNDSVPAFGKKLSKAVEKYFGEKIEINIENLCKFIKLKGAQMLNDEVLYDDDDDLPAGQGVPYSELVNMKFDRIKGTISTYEMGNRKGVYFTAQEFYAD